MVSSNRFQTKMATVYRIGLNGSIGLLADGALQFGRFVTGLQVITRTNVT